MPFQCLMIGCFAIMGPSRLKFGKRIGVHRLEHREWWISYGSYCSSYRRSAIRQLGNRINLKGKSHFERPQREQNSMEVSKRCVLMKGVLHRLAHQSDSPFPCMWSFWSHCSTAENGWFRPAHKRWSASCRINILSGIEWNGHSSIVSYRPVGGCGVWICSKKQREKWNKRMAATGCPLQIEL